ncbi:MAG: signal peptidase I [Dehalococcoidia bacterium]|nr:signal peptidase I [Dehalococcoidia bacterium]MCB9484287.1 signal peptidase I [Dehalococcoidia bacterium]
MVDRRRALLGVLAALGIGILATGGAYLGVHLPGWLDGELEDTRATLQATQRELDTANARIAALEETRDSQAQTIASMNADAQDRERELGNLQSALALSGPLTEQYSQMTDELSTLKAEHDVLQKDYSALLDSMSPLVAIRTPELGGDALYLDRSVGGVTYTGAVCSGSMEPNITCDDLLILYPPKVTDLEVGDIIYFRRQAPGCTGAMDGRFILHRIVEVTAGSEGLAFRTKGDALEGPDPCAVPATDVLYKLLTNVRDARIDG